MLVLCLLCALATTAQLALVGFTSGSEPAQQEELTLLFHGALQLSQALNGSVQGHGELAAKAGDSLSLYGQVLGLLGRRSARARMQPKSYVRVYWRCRWALQLGCCGVSRSLWWSYAWADLGVFPEVRGFLEYRISMLRSG